MYVRVKRATTTWFIEAGERDSVLSLKKKIAELLPGRTAKELQLQVSSTKQAGAFLPLEDDNKLDQVDISDDSVVFLSLWVPGSDSNPADGKWELVQVPEFSPLDDAPQPTPAPVATTAK